tara:strand:+ start:439 stop:645 length:207 start_codon:yes stop_codon:yes gene_type:complete
MLIQSKDVNTIKKIVNFYCDISDDENAKDKVQHAWTNILQALHHAHTQNSIMKLMGADLDRRKNEGSN